MKFILKSFFVSTVFAGVIFFSNSLVVLGQINSSAQSPYNSGVQSSYNSSAQSPYNSGAQSSYNSSAGCTNFAGFCFQNPLKVSTICGLIQKLLTALLVLGTPIAVLALVYAGFMFVLARGNAEKLVQAQKNLIYVLMGIAIFFGSWVLGQVIANTINTIKPGTVNSSNSCN